MSASSPAIVIQSLRVVRGQTAILDDISCSIPAGQCTAILGPNGSGKTTLTRAITGHTFMTSGQVTVLGQTIGRTDIRALRRRIGVVNPTASAADHHVAGSVVDSDLSARDAVLTGFFGTVGLYDQPTDQQKQHADRALDDVGLHDRRELRFALLSTGEQRRCMIARALVHRPDLLILDEPTAGLDLAGREQVLATVAAILADRAPPTVLLITHHVEELLPCTKHVLLMRHGRITAYGTPKDVITPESLSATFGCKVFVTHRNGRYWLEVLPEAWLELGKAGEQESGSV